DVLVDTGVRLGTCDRCSPHSVNRQQCRGCLCWLVGWLVGCGWWVGWWLCGLGSDVLKALALGAKAVLIGRPVLYGLTVNGADGVTHVINILKKDLACDMAC